MVALIASLSVPDPSYLALYLLFAEVAGFLAAVLSIVLYVVFYFLTGEYMNREELLLIVNFVFSLAWWSSTQPLSGPLYSAFDQAYASNAVGMTELMLLLSAASLALLVAPLFMYFIKYLRFTGLEKRLARVRSEYDSIKGEAASIERAIEDARGRIREIRSLIDRATWLRGVAVKNPNILISGVKDSPRTPKPIRPSVYYVICGLGGTGSALLEGFIDYLLSQGFIEEDEARNPYLFVFFDTSNSNIARLKKKYAGTPAEKLVYIFDNFSALTPDNIVSRNPWLTGQDVNLIDGTGNRRAVGYAAYNTVRDALMRDLSLRITRMINKVNINPPNFLIVTLNALGGGTGSGSFISCARDIASTLRQTTARPYILGFGVLPKSEEGPIFHANAYAALKELQFMLSRGKEKLGESAPFANPYTAYFLVSRDRPSATVDEEISLAITKFILELGVAGYEQGGAGARVSGHQGYDLEDIRFRASMAPDSFFTFGRYDVYFPASRISWLINVALPVKKEVEESYGRLSKDVSGPLSDSLKGYSSKVESLRKEVAELRDDVKRLMPQLYRRWLPVAEKANSELAAMDNDMAEGGPLSPGKFSRDYNTLVSPVGTPDDSMVVLEKQVVNRFRDMIVEEEEFLKSPPAKSIEYAFSVSNPEGFNVDVLFRETASLYSILQSMDRLEDYGNALRRLVGTTGLAEQSMANVDFTRVNVPLNYTTDVAEFIARHNKALVTREGPTGQPTVVSPSVTTIVMLVTSAAENMNVPQFPSESAVTQALGGKTRNPDFKRAVIEMKRYDVSSYLIITGIYPYRLLRGEQPILKDLAYLELSYNRLKGTSQSLLMHHTLFYGEPEAFDKLVAKYTGDYVSGRVPSEAVKVISGFWASYDPEIEYIDVWGVLELANAYAEVSAIKRDIEELVDFMDKALASLERGATDVDVGRVQGLLTGGVNVERLKAINDVAAANRFARNEEVAKALADLTNELNGLFSYFETVKASINDWAARLNSIKEKRQREAVLVIKVLQPLINEVNRVDVRIKEIEDSLREVLGAISA